MGESKGSVKQVRSSVLATSELGSVLLAVSLVEEASCLAREMKVLLKEKLDLVRNLADDLILSLSHRCLIEERWELDCLP